MFLLFKFKKPNNQIHKAIILNKNVKGHLMIYTHLKLQPQY